ncbi:MAG: DUF1592 domain-containing protein [Polyangiaceae bacterium]
MRALGAWALAPWLLAALLGTACSSRAESPGAAAGASPSGGTASGASGASGRAGGSSGGVNGSSGSGPVSLDVGTKVIHRLGNTEYDNTTRDLLGTSQTFGSTFASEEADGFDNIAEAMSMSPRNVESYFNAARELSAAVFADARLRARILTCTLDATDATCARTVISSFGKRAFRRPLEPAEEQWLMGRYDAAKALGETPAGAMQHVVHVVLSAPQFLYRIEFDPDLNSSTQHPLSGYELASRLSYALWSSMPDETLFALAASGELSSESAIRAQVDRMLDDSRSDMLVKNFAAQWLGIRRLSEHAVSATVYPEWTPELSSSAQQEMELYFSEFLRKDLSFSEFLTADFNFVDVALARHYGMPVPTQTGFSRVVNTTDQRQGLLGLAGFLTHTSRETRSSPIIRGKWVLDAFVCLKLALPPGLVVEPLPEPAEGDAPKTVRELIATHRAAPACGVCHNLIDPIGLALENFDGVGGYRATYENGLAIDTSGVLPSGAPVNSMASLATELTKDPRFLSCAATKLNTYALGRAVGDVQSIAQIVAKWTAGTPTLRNLIKETVTHVTFTQRRADTQ